MLRFVDHHALHSGQKGDFCRCEDFTILFIPALFIREIQPFFLNHQRPVHDSCIDRHDILPEQPEERKLHAAHEEHRNDDRRVACREEIPVHKLCDQKSERGKEA